MSLSLTLALHSDSSITIPGIIAVWAIYIGRPLCRALHGVSLHRCQVINLDSRPRHLQGKRAHA